MLSFSMLLTPSTNSTERTLFKELTLFYSSYSTCLFSELPDKLVSFMLVLVGLFGKALWPVFGKLYPTAAHVRSVCVISLHAANQ